MKTKHLKIALPLFVTIALLTLAVFLLTSCQTESYTDFNFKFEVTDAEGATQTWDIGTNKTTVGEALREAEIIEEEGYVTKVNGITADWNADKSYWAFYIDGEFAMTGVDDTLIKEGATYAFIYTTD